jgi:hypothetical protein
LKNIYVGLGLPWPAYLDTPVAAYQAVLQRHPVAFMTPIIDGEDTHYFEWQSAGLMSLRAQATMHRSESCFSDLYFGFDRGHLYLRIDFDRPAWEALHTRFLRIDLHSVHQDMRIDVRAGEGRPNAACQSIVEVKVPFEALDITFGQSFEVMLVLIDQQEIERFPQSGSLTLTVPSEELEVENWMV